MDADMGENFAYYWETQRYLESEELVDRYAATAGHRSPLLFVVGVLAEADYKFDT
jgi:hypothetical protein